jgi:hypothetical protein
MKVESKVGMHAVDASELSVTCGDEASCDPTVPSSCLDCLRGPQLSASLGKHPMWRSPRSPRSPKAVTTTVLYKQGGQHGSQLCIHTRELHEAV